MNDHHESWKHAVSQLAVGALKPFLDCFADDVVWTIVGTTPWSRSYRGAAEVRAMLSALQARLDGPYRMRVERFVTAGEWVVVQGKGDNVLLTGDRYDNTYCWVCRLEGERLVELTEYMDTALVMRVFGAARQPVSGALASAAPARPTGE
jgi:uncharacterized protein